MKIYLIRILLWMFVFFFSACWAQKKPEQVKQDRVPVAAGSFYPSDKAELLQMLDKCFQFHVQGINQEPLALIVPHAGYIFSGQVAAAGYQQIDRNKAFQHIFIIGSSHTMYFEGASLYTSGDFITPLGKVQIDTLTQYLADHSDVLDTNIQPHLKEHALEVQLPFLQYWLKKPFSIVPIVIGGESEVVCDKISKVLKPYFNERNLFIISTDFSHYPGYADAYNSDRALANAIMTNSPEKFLYWKHKLENSHTNGLITAMCGWTSVLSLLDMTQNLDAYNYQPVFYQNSGDSQAGDKQKVVGYYAIAVTGKEKKDSVEDFRFSEADKAILLEIARTTLQEYITNHIIPPVDKRIITPVLLSHSGAFVTLHKNKELRGCIGNFKSDNFLYETIQSMAIASATKDPRFSPVTTPEIDSLDIEISVLSPMQKVNSLDDIQLGKHGIYIQKGNHSGTFLPQVATETGWNKEEFLGHCARDKALIGWNGWKDADIYIYETIVFGELKSLKK